MQLATFDTHSAVKKLISAGVAEKQAEEIINVIRTSQDTDLSKLVSKEQFSLLERDFENFKDIVATKADISDLRTELKTEIGNLRTELKTEIGDLRTELKTEIADLRTELKTEIHTTKNDTIKWFVAISFTQISVIAAILKFWAH